MNDQATLLDIRQLNVAFGGLKALQDVNLSIAPGEMIAVVGPNGAGKTTLLNAISGVIGTSAGSQITMRGKDIGRLSVAARAHAGIGRSFQHPPLLEASTVLDNVRCGGHSSLEYGVLADVLALPRVFRAERHLTERALRALELVGLTEHQDTVTAELPFGMRKLVDIARAIVAASRLLLLDEPSSGLDSTEQHIVVRVLKALKEQQTIATVVVEHHMDVVRATATRVVGMEAGTVLKTGTPTEVLDAPEFREAVVGRAAQPTGDRDQDG
jgi:branched-chain amino acid transport system ATP-binding protein